MYTLKVLCAGCRGKILLGDVEDANIYNLLHPMDLEYFTDAHKESEYNKHWDMYII